jgi:hypothetical protein
MPSFCKNALKGIQKPHAPSHSPTKSFFYGMKKANTYLSNLLPQNWIPMFSNSSVFDTRDCIWYYGTLYVRESVAVAKLLEQQKQVQEQEQVKEQEQVQVQQLQPDDDADDDDAESTSSCNSNHYARNVGKHNQLKYLKNGMRLRHLILSNHEFDQWNATFDAETNRIIRSPDGVAFDTLRQFARLHCNEVLAITSTLGNVWSNANFQYQDAAGNWHPLSKLKHAFTSNK